MSNVLDLKNPPKAEDDSDATSDISSAEASTSSDLASMDAGSMSVEDIAAMMLAGSSAPRTISWEAEHALQGTARRKHYIMLGALAVAGLLLAFWQASLTVFLVVLAGIGALEARQQWGRPVRVAVDEHGIDIDGHRYAHADVASFDIHTMPDGAMELSLHSGRWHMPHLRLPLGGQNHGEIRTVLTQYIPEGRHPIPYIDYLIRKP